MFSGSIPALVTPFRDGAVDAEALRRLVEWQIAEGSAALVPCGTTGESATLGFDEHYRVIEQVIEVAAGRVPVIAGVGSNDTATAVRHMAFAKAAGATAGGTGAASTQPSSRVSAHRQDSTWPWEL